MQISAVNNDYSASNYLHIAGTVDFSSFLTRKFVASNAKSTAGAAEIAGLMGNRAPVKTPSVFDLTNEEILTKYNEIKADIDTWDFTGMSDADIYKAIKERFSDTFGADFREANVLYGPFTDTRTSLPVSAFERALARHVAADDKVDMWRRALGYDGTLPEYKGVTLADAILRSDELRRLGLEDVNVGGAVKNMTRLRLADFGMKMGNLDDFKPIWQAMLDEPADYDALSAAANAKYADFLSGKIETVKMNDLPGEFGKFLLSFGLCAKRWDYYAELLKIANTRVTRND